MNPRPVIAILIALTFTAGIAHAQPSAAAGDDSFESFDLTSVGGGVIYIMCQNFDDKPDTLTECKRPSVWLEENGLNGLQSTLYNINGKAYPRDMSLLP